MARPKNADVLYRRLIAQAEAEIIRRGVARCDGNVSATATWFEVSVQYLQTRIKLLGLRDDIKSIRAAAKNDDAEE